MWNKIVGFFKKIGSLYYNWRKRNEELSEFLRNAKTSGDKLDSIGNSVGIINDDIQTLKGQVNELGEQVSHINGRLEIIGEGTKMELFDTLHNWRNELVVKRGWASKAEKKEVENIFNIYNKGLKGNGQGEVYYKQIMDLPEDEEEMRRKNGGK